MKQFFLFILLATLASCGRRIIPATITETVIKDTTITNTVYIPKDTIVYLPGDTLHIYEAIPCPDVSFNKTVNSSKSNLSVKTVIKNGMLEVDCKTDSLQHRIEWLEAQIITERSKSTYQVKTVPYAVIKYKVPRWCWLLLLGVIAAALWRFRSPILSLIKRMA